MRQLAAVVPKRPCSASPVARENLRRTNTWPKVKLKLTRQCPRSRNTRQIRKSITSRFHQHISTSIHNVLGNDIVILLNRLLEKSTWKAAIALHLPSILPRLRFLSNFRWLPCNSYPARLQNVSRQPPTSLSPKSATVKGEGYRPAPKPSLDAESIRVSC